MATLNKISMLFPNLSDFSILTELHLNTIPGTRELEVKAQNLVTARLPGTMLQEFIESVHRWSGSFRNYYKVIENARPTHFINALKALNASPPLIERALSSLLEIYGLGISYGSKHLRFLRPDLCPILDNIVWDKFKYSWDTRGYRLLQVDIMNIAKSLEENGIKNPMSRQNGQWYAADVDMAVFAFLQREKRSCGWV